MPFIKRCSSNIKQIFLVEPAASQGNLRRPSERETEGRKTMKGELISQTVTYGSFMLGLINVIQIPINEGN